MSSVIHALKLFPKKNDLSAIPVSSLYYSEQCSKENQGKIKRLVLALAEDIHPINYAQISTDTLVPVYHRPGIKGFS